MPNNSRRKVYIGVTIGVVLFLWIFAFDDGSSGGNGPTVRRSNKPWKPNTQFHGGDWQPVLRTGAELDRLKDHAASLVTLQLNDRQLCDIEMLMSGAFAPLRGFMDETTFNGVVTDMRLPKHNNALFPMPITLDVSATTASQYSVGQELALRDKYYNLIATITLSDIYKPRKSWESETVFQTLDTAHPGAKYVLEESGEYYLGGELKGVQLPIHYSFTDIRRTPQETRAWFKENGWDKVIGFQTRNPMHRAHIELTRFAVAETGAHLMIHPAVGMTKPGDIDFKTRVNCYRTVMATGTYWDEGVATLSLMPLAMRMAGPREALWHAIIRYNYGCTHFIVGRDHAGTKDQYGEDVYGAYDAQQLVEKHADEIGITVLTYPKLVYVQAKDAYYPATEVKEKGWESLSISGTEFRKRLRTGEDIPEWFSNPKVVELLRLQYPPMSKRGFTIFFTGYSGSGKTTVAQALLERLESEDSRRITLLDGDVVRTYLSSNLGFSHEDRNTNVVRVGYVASEITKNGGVALTSTIGPYRQSRDKARELVEAYGGFIEVWISTPLEVCRSRDVKGLYAKSDKGLLKGLTGVDDPYEPPLNPELNIDTSQVSVSDAAEQIIVYLQSKGFLTAGNALA